MTTQSVTSQHSQTTANRYGSLWVISLVLVALGLAVSGYLTYVKYSNTEMVCLGGGAFDCSAVQNSSYSMMELPLIGRQPIAVLGLASYIVLAAILLLERAKGLLGENALMVLFGITLFAWLYSMYLIYVQAVLLQAYCMWCLAHELIMTVLFAITAWRVVQSSRAV